MLNDHIARFKPFQFFLCIDKRHVLKMSSNIHFNMIEHSKIISSIIPWEGKLDPDCIINFLGVKTRWSFLEFFFAEGPADMMGLGLETTTGIKIQSKTCKEIQNEIKSYFDAHEVKPSIKTTHPPFKENYFEWIDLFEAVISAKKEFIMIDLGAGYGRWLVNGAFALHFFNPLPYRLIGVEAEPTHFKYMKQHFIDNHINLRHCELINKVITVQNHRVERFWVGDPAGWYGQAIQEEDTRDKSIFIIDLINRLLNRWMSGPDEILRGKQTIHVPAISLTAILQKYNRIDYIDMDVQGAEFSILNDSMTDVNKKVKRIHIGTHSHEIEKELRSLFTEHSWMCRHDYQCQSECDTPYGKIMFGDGVQTWINEKIN